MQSRMKEPYRKGVANRLASSLAEAVARLPSKRRQRYQWEGMELRKPSIGMPTLLPEGHTRADGNASRRVVPRSRRPQAR